MKKTFLLTFAIMAFVFNARSASITVSIDMTSYAGPSFTNVMMNGGFKGWGDAVALTTDNDSLIWTANVTMNPGMNDYRFEVTGGNVGWTAEWESVGGANSVGNCFVNPDGNPSNMRWVTVNGDSILPTAAWQKCTNAPDAPIGGQITLSINMTSYTGPSFTEVKMNGGYCGWSSPVNLSTDNDSLIWTTTVSMNAGVNDYRFEVAGGKVGWTAEWESVGGANSVGDCFVNPDGNQSNMRWITVNGDATLPTAAWEACEATTNGTSLISGELTSIFLSPNPASDFVSINNLNSDGEIIISNLSGQLILNQKVQASERINIQNLVSGLYLIKLKTTDSEKVFKLVKN